MAQDSSFTEQQPEHLHNFVSNTADLTTSRLYSNYIDKNMKTFKNFLTTEEHRENRLLKQYQLLIIQYNDIATRYKRAWANNHDHFC